MAIPVKASGGFSGASGSVDCAGGTVLLAFEFNTLDRVTSTSTTYSGVALTKVWTSTPDGLAMWKLLGPVTGSNALARSGGSGDNRLSWISLAGTTENRAGTPDYGADHDITVSPTVDGDMVIDFYCGDATSPAGNPTPDAGQTLIYADWLDYGPANTYFGSSYKVATGITTAMGWDVGNKHIAAVAMQAAGGGNQVIWLAFRRWQSFLRDLRLGLVPPDMLQRRYREAVTI